MMRRRRGRRGDRVRVGGQCGLIDPALADVDAHAHVALADWTNLLSLNQPFPDTVLVVEVFARQFQHLFLVLETIQTDDTFCIDPVLGHVFHRLQLGEVGWRKNVAEMQSSTPKVEDNIDDEECTQRREADEDERIQERPIGAHLARVDGDEQC